METTWLARARTAVRIVLFVVAAGALAACGGSSAPPTSARGGGVPPQQASIDNQLPSGTASTAERCDFLDPSYCLFPFPNDYFTVADGSTDTGRRVNLQRASMPRSRIVLDKPIDPAEWNRNDGFSPGAMIELHVPGVDLAKTGAPPISDIPRSLEADSPILLIDAATLERQPIWAELDMNNVSSSDRQALIIRVARNLQYGHRYIVALRELKDASGQPIEAGPAFRIYRDNHASSLDFVNARRAHMEDLFATLARAGVARSDLYLAWDFTVASQRSLTGRMLHIRDDAFASFANGVPQFKITQVTDYTADQNPKIARQVEGTVTVPTYLFIPDSEATLKPITDLIEQILAAGASTPLPVDQLQGLFALLGDQDLPLTRFYYGKSDPGPYDLPQRFAGGTLSAPFTCIIPRAVLNADGSVKPARIALYGHGLFGSRDEVTAGNVEDMANEHDFVFCATNWMGFSQGDLPNALITLLDVSNARSFFDTTQQGVLNFLALGRALLSPQGFTTQDAFRMGTPARSVLDTTELYYDGNSQGGILGGMLMSVAQDITRGVLGVPGMNYSLLLERSSDFATYSRFLYAAYPDSLDQEFIFSLLQMLWDRAEANGYAAALTTGTLPGTPRHQVLLHVAFGDFQVSMWAAQNEARTIGAQRHCPSLEPGRNPDTAEFPFIPCMTDEATGHDGSAFVIWDSGPDKVAPPPTDDVPPSGDHDPHGDPRATPAARLQKSEFLKPDGRVIDVCGGKPCGAAGYVPP
jgi:hypothetical protein